MVNGKQGGSRDTAFRAWFGHRMPMRKRQRTGRSPRHYRDGRAGQNLPLITGYYRLSLLKGETRRIRVAGSVARVRLLIPRGGRLRAVWKGPIAFIRHYSPFCGGAGQTAFEKLMSLL